MTMRHDTHTIHTITIPMPDDILGKIAEGDEVQVQFISRSVGRMPAPMRLSYTTLRRLLHDD